MTPDLERLAAAHGVATSYENWESKPVQVKESAVVAALAALDVDASTPVAVTAALQEVEDARWREVLPPVVVVRRQGEVTVRAETRPRGDILYEDGGMVMTLPAVATDELHGRRRAWTLPIPWLPLGWHTLTVLADGESHQCVLVVAPERIELPASLDRTWGWMVQLYSLRSAGSWGLGDYRDLRTVVESSARDGAGAVLLNPLHAESPVLPINASPYSPSSRRFRSALYLRIEDIPEYADASAAVRELVDALRPVTPPDRIDRDTAWAAKLAALELLWPHARRDAIDAFRAERGEALEEFALFCALAEEHGVPWQSWPEDLQHPGAPGIEPARAAHADRIAFWCWVQLLVDEQLAGAGDGMVVGVIHDLAVGVDAGGADAWSLQDVLALGTTACARSPTRRTATWSAACCATRAGSASTT